MKLRLSYFVLFIVATIPFIHAQTFSYNMVTGMYSLHNKKGKVICDQRFYEVRPFKNGKAWVKDTTGSYHSLDMTNKSYDIFQKKDYGMWGIINKKGEWVIPPKYNKLDSFVDGFAKVGNFKYIYSWYKKIPPEMVDGVPQYDDTVAWFNGIEKDGNYLYLRNMFLATLWGYVDENGKEIIPTIYPEIYNFINGRVLARRGLYNFKSDSVRNLITTPNYVLLDNQGKVVSEINHMEVVPQYTLTEANWYWKVSYVEPTPVTYYTIPQLYAYEDIQNNVSYYGLIDNNGKDIIPANKYYQKFEHAVVCVIDSSDPYNVVDCLITEYQRPPFTLDSTSGQLFFKFYMDSINVHSLITDKNGQIIFKSSPETYFVSFPNPSFRFLIFNQPNGKYIMNFVCPVMNSYTDTLSKFFGQFKSYPNTEIVPYLNETFDSSFHSFSHPLYMIHRDSTYGLLNKNLKEIIPISFAYEQEIFDNDLDPIYAVGTKHVEPILNYMSEPKQYVFVGKDLKAGTYEAYLISRDGEIVAKIPNCTDISWNIDAGAYNITLNKTLHLMCDTKGNIK